MIVKTLLSLGLCLTAFSASVPAFAQESFTEPGTAGGEVTKETALEAWRADPSTVFQADQVDLSDFLWVARPLVVFADSPNQPDYQQQMDLIEARIDNLAERDVLIVVDADPSAQSDLRRELRPRGFQLTIVGKDGEVKLRKPSPWSVREITRSIDKMPMRQREMRERS